MALDGSNDDRTQSFVALTAGTAVSHYEILEKIGAGGMGEVYLAEDTELNRKVALKFLPLHLCQDADCRARFKREAQAAAKLDHPNIVAVHEVGEFQGRPFFAMQHVEGQSLKEVLTGKTLPVDRILEIGIQVCEGLQAAHESGITHRDIKPLNILIDSHGRARIVDFGLAKGTSDATLTTAGTLVGTVSYMSPEQVAGGKIDQRSDIWSLGIVLYEALTGRLPFQGESITETLAVIVSRQCDSVSSHLPEVPARLDAIVSRALAKDAKDRYQNVKEMRNDLEAVLAETEELSGDSAVTTSWRHLMNRKVPHLILIYVLAALSVYEILRWLADRFLWSSHLAELVMVAMLVLLPSVFVWQFLRGASPRRRARRVKGIVPAVNVILAVILLSYFYGGRNLGAVTQTVTYQDEQGQNRTRVMPKYEYRRSLAIFAFVNPTHDTLLEWMQQIIPAGVQWDLYQDQFVRVQSPMDFYYDLREAGYTKGIGEPITFQAKFARERFLKSFLVGSIRREGKDYAVTVTLHDSKTGRPLAAERSFKGADVFALIDSVSRQVRYDLGIPSHYIDTTIDMPVAALTTHSIVAMEYFATGLLASYEDDDIETATEYVKTAVDEDSTFAVAHLLLESLYALQGGPDDPRRRWSIGQLMKHLDRLPERVQIDAKYNWYHSFLKKDEEAFRLARMYVELYPDDVNAQERLAGEYRERGDRGKMVKLYELIVQLDPDRHDLLITLGWQLEKAGRADSARACFERYVSLHPELHDGYGTLARFHFDRGEFDKAIELWNKAATLEPLNSGYEQSIAWCMFHRGNFDSALAILKGVEGEAAFDATSNAQKSAYQGLADYYLRRGQVDKFTEYKNRKLALLAGTAFSEEAAMDSLDLMRGLVATGQKDSAMTLLRSTVTGIPGIMGKVVEVYAKVQLYLYLHRWSPSEDSDSLLFYLEKFAQMPAAEYLFDFDFGDVTFWRGKVAELKGNLDSAIAEFHKTLDWDAGNEDARLGLGYCYRMKREYGRAQRILEDLVRVSPYTINYRMEMARLEQDLGHIDAAIEHAQVAVRVWENADPDFVPAQKARVFLEELRARQTAESGA